jgi:hypothetical protein
MLLRWLAARARAGGIGGLFGDRILNCSATRSCTPTSWRFNRLDLRTGRVGSYALGVIVFDTLVSGIARSGAADLGRGFFDTGSLRAASVKASSLGDRLLRRLFDGAAIFSAIDLDGWSLGGLVLQATRASAGIRVRLLDRPAAFTRTLSQAKAVLRGLVLGGGTAADAGIQRSAKKGASRRLLGALLPV